jgi:Fe-S-cluster containining protein
MIDALPDERRAAIEARFVAAREAARDAGLLDAISATLDGQPFERNIEWFSARIACPFLDPVERTCTIYAARPLACREHLVSTPPAACDDTTPGAVRSIPLLGRLARALTRVSTEAWPEAPSKLPLLLAPEWARRNTEAASVTRSGVELLKRLLDSL